MAEMYYLFSKKHRLESVYLCDDGDYIDTPILQTGVYPMGTLLSKAIRILTPWFNENDIFLCGEKLLDGFENFTKKDSSFSNIVCDDYAVLKIFECLLTGNKYIISHDKRIELLPSYIDYVRLCQEEKEYCTIEKLDLILNKNSIELPYRSTYVADRLNDKNILSKDDISELLANPALSEQYFMPVLKTQRKDETPMHIETLFLGKTSTPMFLVDYHGIDLPEQVNATPWGAMTTPIFAFKIHDIVDFILASLHCIFEQNYFIRKCDYCENLFITNDRKQTHCPKQDLNIKNKSCAKQAKLERQKEHEKKESVKLHKSLRVMIADKYGTSSNESFIFLEESKAYRNKIKAGEETEENYIEWLKSFYIRKYK